MNLTCNSTLEDLRSTSAAATTLGNTGGGQTGETRTNKHNSPPHIRDQHRWAAQLPQSCPDHCRRLDSCRHRYESVPDHAARPALHQAA